MAWNLHILEKIIVKICNYDSDVNILVVHSYLFYIKTDFIQNTTTLFKSKTQK